MLTQLAKLAEYLDQNAMIKESDVVEGLMKVAILDQQAFSMPIVVKKIPITGVELNLEENPLGKLLKQYIINSFNACTADSGISINQSEIQELKNSLFGYNEHFQPVKTLHQEAVNPKQLKYIIGYVVYEFTKAGLTTDMNCMEEFARLLFEVYTDEYNEKVLREEPSLIFKDPDSEPKLVVQNLKELTEEERAKLWARQDEYLESIKVKPKQTVS